MAPGLPGEFSGDMPEGTEQTEQAAAREETIADLFKEHNRALHAFLITRLRDEHEARGGRTRSLRLRMLQLDQPGAVGFLRSYLFKTAANIAIDRAKQRNTRARLLEAEALEEPVDQLSPDRHLFSVEDMEIFKRALLELSPKCRRAFAVSARRVERRSDRGAIGRPATHGAPLSHPCGVVLPSAHQGTVPGTSQGGRAMNNPISNTKTSQNAPTDVDSVRLGEAWKWVLRLREDSVDQDDLAAWLRWYADARNKDAFEDMQSFWQQAERVVEEPNPLAPELWLGEPSQAASSECFRSENARARPASGRGPTAARRRRKFFLAGAVGRRILRIVPRIRWMPGLIRNWRRKSKRKPPLSRRRQWKRLIFPMVRASNWRQSRRWRCCTTTSSACSKCRKAKPSSKSPTIASGLSSRQGRQHQRACGRHGVQHLQCGRPGWW